MGDCVLWLSMIWVAGSSLPTQESHIRWNTGRSFEEMLAGSVGVWKRGEFRSELLSLSKRQRVAIFLDRRIDPNQMIEWSYPETRFSELLEQMAEGVGAEMVVISDVAYVGPTGQTAMLPMLAKMRSKEVKKLPPKRAKRFTEKRPLRWAAGSEPRTLLSELATEAGVGFVSLDQIPHDVWPAVDLPALTWTDRLTIVLAGFGLTFSFDEQGTSVRLVPIPETVRLERSYSHTLSQVRLSEIVSEFAGTGIRVTENRIVLEGTVEDHARLQRLLQRQAANRSNRTKDAPSTVFTLRVERQQIGSILNAISKRSGLELDVDAVTRQQLEQRVSVDAKEATLTALLDMVLTPGGLAHRLQRGSIVILSKPEE